MKLIGILRGAEFSPNMTDSDAAILQAVAEALRHRGHEVETMSEQDFVSAYRHNINKVCDIDCIFGMYRRTDTIEILHRIETEFGIPCVNPMIGIENSSRLRLTKLFREMHIPMPESWILPMEAELPLKYPAWMKRGEGCAQEKDDVVYVENEAEAAQAMQHFRERGLGDAIVACTHLEGDLIKFYGVEGTSFFDWSYASGAHSKFGLEERNGVAKGFSFSLEALKEMADRAAKGLHLPVYGGDCIVSSEGSIGIIDFNDWPSFSRCRAEASKAIAERILKYNKK